MTVFNSFADLAQARINLADAREGITESYDGAFLEHSDLAKLNIIEAPIAAEMPDPDMARRAVSTRSPRRGGSKANVRSVIPLVAAELKK